MFILFTPTNDHTYVKNYIDKANSNVVHQGTGIRVCSDSLFPVSSDPFTMHQNNGVIDENDGIWYQGFDVGTSSFKLQSFTV